MLNRSASLAMATSILKALIRKLDIKRHSPSILSIYRPQREKKKSQQRRKPAARRKTREVIVTLK